MLPPVEFERQQILKAEGVQKTRGLTISLLQRNAQRSASLEFPPPKRLLKGLARGRLQLDDATISRGVRAALEAGWEPTSRGKPMVFTVDSEGN